jgi:hypothetical protein
VPVVVVPVVDLTASAGLTAGPSLTLGLGQTTNITTSVSWDSSSGWNGSANNSTNFTLDPPQFNPSLAADATVTAGAEAEVLFYGIAGPGLEVDAYAKGHLDPAGGTCWSIDAGIQALASVNVDVDLKIIKLQLEKDLALFNANLAHWDSGSPCTSPPPPPAAATPTSTPSSSPGSTATSTPTPTAHPNATATPACGQVYGQHCTAIWFETQFPYDLCFSVPKPSHVRVVLTDTVTGQTAEIVAEDDSGVGACIGSSYIQQKATQAGIQFISYRRYRFTEYVYDGQNLIDQASVDLIPPG